MQEILVTLFVFLGYLVNITGGSCTLPDELTGLWHSAQRGPLTINSTHIMDYPIYMSVAVQSFDWECIEQSERKYVFQSTKTAFIFGNDFTGFLCLEFWRVSATKYYYLIHTPITVTNNDHVFARLVGTTAATATEACTDNPTDSSFVTLVEDGSVESGASEATCATDLLNEFTNVTISQHNDASSCTNNVMDGCSSKTKMSFTYDASCTGVHKFSAGGNWTCLRSITKNGYTYVSLWNNDTAVTLNYVRPYSYNTGETYRFACMVVSGSSATLFPKICSDDTQTPTSVSFPGLKLTFSGASSTCHVTTEDESDAIYYVIIILGSLFVISLVILLVILYKKGVFRKCKRKCSKSHSIASLEIIMSKPPLKVQPLYRDESFHREKTDVISVLEFNMNFNVDNKLS
uniref:Uncharacterized protein LOC111126189 isoform X2 n=1 Tax=Crassostrea virginica TaxID=6565 RepID=A0A8B8DHB2_CRAVI|nr:uncharacterized protein LOC111126189 isoform X2 [Crassostrea virginica]